MSARDRRSRKISMSEGADFVREFKSDVRARAGSSMVPAVVVELWRDQAQIEEM
jgi:hypothetical protein